MSALGDVVGGVGVEQVLLGVADVLRTSIRGILGGLTFWLVELDANAQLGSSRRKRAMLSRL